MARADSHTQFWRTTWQGQSKITSCRNVAGPRYDNCVGDEVIERMDDLPYDLDSIMITLITRMNNNNYYTYILFSI